MFLSLSSARPILAIATLAGLAGAVPQGCTPTFLPTFDAGEGTDGRVRDLCVFDDGTGPALFVAGDFLMAGGELRNRIAKWDGRRWHSLGSGLDGSVFDLEVYDDGSGPKLYAAGGFTAAGGSAASSIARWDGQQWSALGSGIVGTVRALAVFDPGGGPRLYAGGYFTSAGGAAASRVASWNGSWSTLGLGANDVVMDLQVHDDGTGPKLYAGGAFTTAGGAAASRVARWDGASWSALGAGVWGTVYALESYDAGGGRSLHVGGSFAFAGGVAAPNYATWRGGAWQAGPQVLFGTYRIEEFALADLGSGEQLFALATTSSTVRLAQWANGSWLGLDDFYGVAESLAPFNEGSRPHLFVGGSFYKPSPPQASNLIRYASTGSQPVGNGINGNAFVTATHDTGSGPELYVAGSFPMAGTTLAEGIAKWNGVRWTPLGDGVNAGSAGVTALASHDDGTGSALYIGGQFTVAGGVPANRVARWDGTSWSPVGAGLASSPHAFAEFDDGTGPALWVGGTLDTGAAFPSFAKWDGSSWTDLGVQLQIEVYAMRVWDDGSGPALFVAGRFTNVLGTTVNHIARWDGTVWSALGSGLAGSNPTRALTLAVYAPPGGSEALYVGGDFTTAGGVSTPAIARWDGTSWSAVGTQPLAHTTSWMRRVDSLAVVTVGGTRRLAVAGCFNRVGSAPASSLALWDGAGWMLPSIDFERFYSALEFDDGTGAALFLTGVRLGSGLAGRLDITAFGCNVTPAGQVFCTAGTSNAGCIPAFGATGVASATSASGFTLAASGVDGQRNGLIYYGVAGGMSGPWGGGSSRLCVRAPRARLSVVSAGGTVGACDGALSIDWNAWRSANPGALGQPFVPGETVWAQAWYRDPASPLGSSLTGGVVFQLGP